ncbi:MAG: ferritin-like domain-containing protein [Myxococcales bacterium]|nr:ferritin-like domain-containing protein [Myxococcales bacterium]
MKKKQRPTGVRKDTASFSWRHVLFGGGVFDNTSERPNKKGWDIFELGQKSFWAVPTAVPWDEPVREDPKYADAIAAMLTFLCPGEKTAVTGASYISLQVKSEEAKLYFVEQALEEAKHYDALRRLIPKITGRPLPEPSPMVRLLYSFGVLDPNDVAFMMGNINIVGEHLANQIFHKINHVAVDPTTRQIIALIGKDESRHIGAGQRFFPEVYPELKKRRSTILVKNLATTIILALASYELVNPMQTLEIDLAAMMDKMYCHYQDVVHGLPPFPEQAIRDMILELLRKRTKVAIETIKDVTTPTGEVDVKRLLEACERAVHSPRALRELLAA